MIHGPTEKQGKDDIADAAREQHRQDVKEKDHAEMLHPVGQTIGNQVEDGSHAADKDVHGVGESRGLPDHRRGGNPDKNTGSRKGKNDPRVFKEANMEIHGHPQYAAADKGDKDIADPADDHGAEKADKDRFEEFFLMPPEHGRGGRGAQKGVYRMEDMEQPGGRFRKPYLVKEKSDKT